MALAKAARKTQNIAVLFIDLAKFKPINDTLGHAAGDELLKVGKRIKQALRPYDTAARFGGDEFAVLIEPIAELGQCQVIANKMIELEMNPLLFMTKN